MHMSKFIDEAVIEVKSGKGGDGCVGFRREKYVPKGGPDGGDGGKGGDVIIKGNSHMSSLMDYHYKMHYWAENGKPGRGKKSTGRSAEPMILQAPVGTVVYDEQTGSIIADVDRDGKEVLIAQGGRGGRGNARFTSSTNQTPTYAEEGKPGQYRKIRLELKLLANIGLIGFPNAGKSTLISCVSAAKPKIAGYPFTTLIPNLGIVTYKDEKQLVFADIPGIIENAHKGAGLGLQFLKHVERTEALLHLIDVSPANTNQPVDEFVILKEELKSHHADLAKKPFIIVAAKIDIPGHEEKLEKLRQFALSRDYAFQAISAVTGKGVRELLGKVWQLYEGLTKDSDQ